jgi:hypothetical protein
LPSLQEFELFVCTNPVAGLQASVVHGLPSSQFGAAPPTHTPAVHTSPVVHALPSLQEFELFACTHPAAELQVSVVQGFPSSQLRGVPAVHAPATQCSPVVQALPSLHDVPFVFAGFEQVPVAGSHEPTSWQESLGEHVTWLPPTQD